MLALHSQLHKEVAIRDNTVTDNGGVGINVWTGRESSSHNRVAARIHGNTVERRQIGGIQAVVALGAVNIAAGASNNNVLDVRIERNTVRSVTGDGIGVAGGIGSPDGRAGAVADHNQLTAFVVQNTVEGNTARGIALAAGGVGLANANTAEIRVVDNTVCYNAEGDILGESGSTSNSQFPAPNAGTGNVLEGRIFQNTATTVTVDNGTPGNTADVTQFKNKPCP